MALPTPPPPFKVGDCVQLKHGATPEMTISEIWEDLKEAKCFWHDPKKTQEIFTQTLPFSILKHCPTQMTSEETIKVINEIIPKRNF